MILEDDDLPLNGGNVPLDVGNVEDDDLPLNGGNVQTHVTHPGSPPGGIWLGSARGKSG